MAEASETSPRTLYPGTEPSTTVALAGSRIQLGGIRHSGRVCIVRHGRSTQLSILAYLRGNPSGRRGHIGSGSRYYSRETGYGSTYGATFPAPQQVSSIRSCFEA